MCGIGFFGSTYPVLVAHGRSFLPPHLIGRGVTMLNLCAIGGVGVLQFLSGRIYATAVETGPPLQAYVLVFTLLVGSLIATIYGNETAVSPKAIDVHVHHLRAKLGDEAGRMIQTVRGFGYKLSPPLDVLPRNDRVEASA